MTDYLADISTSYDNVAVSYAELVVDGADGEETAFDLVAGLVVPEGLVLDVGCGPGRTTGSLAARGLRVVGIDLSPGMIEVARRDHPALDFRVGSMTALDLPDGSVAGIVAWWSIIHLPREVVPQAFAEFHRVLAPGGVLLLDPSFSGLGLSDMAARAHPSWTGCPRPGGRRRRRRAAHGPAP